MRKIFELREVKSGHFPVSQIFHASGISGIKLYETFHPCL